jgi:hypothetical protein
MRWRNCLITASASISTRDSGAALARPQAQVFPALCRNPLDKNRNARQISAMKIPRWTVGLIIAFALMAGVIALLGFVHANSIIQTRCFPSFTSAQWPKWIGCAMAAHENLAGGLIGLAGAIFAAWLAFSGAQDQLAQLNRTTREADRLRAQERFQEAASEIDALKLARGYLESFTGNFPSESDGGYLSFNFIGKLAELNRKAQVYLSQSAASAPRGFGRSITTVMWRLEKLAVRIDVLDEKVAFRAAIKNELDREIKGLVGGAKKLADDIGRLLPSLTERLINLKDQYENLGGG